MVPLLYCCWCCRSSSHPVINGEAGAANSHTITNFQESYKNITSAKSFTVCMYVPWYVDCIPGTAVYLVRLHYRWGPMAGAKINQRQTGHEESRREAVQSASYSPEAKGQKKREQRTCGGPGARIAVVANVDNKVVINKKISHFPPLQHTKQFKQSTNQDPRRTTEKTKRA